MGLLEEFIKKIMFFLVMLVKVAYFSSLRNLKIPT